MNFNWGTGSPDAALAWIPLRCAGPARCSRWSSDTYTFYATTDDGVRLWVNNQLVIDAWVDQSPTEHSGTIALVGQQRYNIKMEYYENGGGAQASLSWGSPSITKAIIPQTQLYAVTNPPPVVSLTAPANSSIYTASASVTMAASAASQYNILGKIDFYTNNVFFGSVSNSAGTQSNSLTATMTGLGVGTYQLRAVACGPHRVCDALPRR